MVLFDGLLEQNFISFDDVQRRKAGEKWRTHRTESTEYITEYVYDGFAS